MAPLFRCGTITFWFGTVALMCWPACLRAQSLQIMPIALQMPSGQKTDTVFVINHSSDAKTVQVRPFLWDQSRGAESLTPTEVLAVSPPMTIIEPGATQMFRVLLRQTPQAAESSYRLLFDELPPPSNAFSGVRLTLRLSVPVFAQPPTPTRSQVEWSIFLDHGDAFLHAENHGSQHLRIIHPLLNASTGSALPVPAANGGYVLSGAAQDWPIKASKRFQPGSALRLTAISDQGSVDTMVDVRQR